MAEAHQQSPDAVPARHCHQLAVKNLDFVWEPGYALVRRERHSVPREMRLLAPLAVLYVDAFITAHDAKHTFWRLRPSMADDTIMPLIPPPNHPAYVSNAATIASGAAALIGSMFLQEAAPWQYLSEGTGLSRIDGGIHYPSDERARNQMGKSIGALSDASRWRRVPCITNTLKVGRGDAS